MSTDIAKIALNLLSPLLVAALTWAAARLSRLISARIHNERLRAALLRLDDIVTAVVKETFQVTVEALRAGSKDGKLPPGAGETIKQSAVAAIKAQLGADALAGLQRVLGLSSDATHDLISTRVEAAVFSLKRRAMANGVHAPSEPVGAVGK